MRTLTIPSHIQIAVGVMALALATGCGGEAPDTSKFDQVPSTLAARPTPRMQPPIELEVSPPVRVLNGYAESSADAVWQKSMDLVSNWVLNPRFVQTHTIRKDELSGLLPELTGEAEAKWRASIKKAVPLWMSTTYRPKRMAKAQLEVAQLVLWNTRPPSNRGWDNPMFAPVRVTHGRVIGNSDMVVMFQFHTAWRWRGGGMQYELPYDSFMMLSWRRVDGDWKLATAARTWTLKPERLVGPPEAVKSSKAAKASRSAEPEPSARPSTRPTVIDSAP
jgi:hypothetical protein